MGLVTPLGLGLDTNWRRLLAGHTAVRRLEQGDLPEAQRSYLPQLPCQIAAVVPRAEVEAAAAALGEDSRRNSPCMTYMLVAADEAWRDAGWTPQSEEQRRYTGVAVGCGMSSTAEVAAAAQLLADNKLRRMSPFFVPRILINMAAGAVGIRYGLRGPNHSVSTACATGVHSIGDAFRMIQRGDARVMLAGATEASVDAVSIAGFCRLKALSTSRNDEPTLASRPFDAGRDGFVMGEGAGAVVLEDLEHAHERGARIYAEVRGYGLSGDGHHVTQPHPEGLGARLAMQRALHGSGVGPAQVAYINAHATSTPLGDEIEQGAIHATFGEELCRRLAVSSTKGATGHLLGAAGAVESVFSVLALHYHMAPPTVNLERPDPPQLLPALVGRRPVALSSGPKAVLCNSFGFGGTNASLLFTTPASSA